MPAAWDVLWSLSVEEVFYVLFPLLCTWLRKSLLIAALLALIVTGPFARVMTHNPLWADYGFLACMDGIALGCLAAIFSTKVKLIDKANMLFRIAGGGLALLIVVFRGTAARIGLYKAGLDVTVLSIGTAMLVIALQQSFATSAVADSFGWARKLSLSTAVLRWFGHNSYEVYLTHMLVVWPMVMLFFRFHQSIDMAPLWFVATAALTGIMGYAVAQWYSEPLNRKLRAGVRKSPRSAMRAASD